MICKNKNCNKSFHACNSCGLIGHEYDYCSNKCWYEDKKTFEELLKEEFKEILQNKELCKKLNHLINEDSGMDNYRFYVLTDLIEEKANENN